MYSVSDETRKPIFEGVQGENESREIQFDISSWIEESGDGACTATAKRPTDTTPYPVTVTRSGNVVTWKPNSTDTSIEGIGAFQLSFSINNVVAKTRIWNTKIAPSLVGAGDPPDPYDDWIQDLREIAAETLINAQNAEDSAEDAEAWAVGQRGGVDVPSTDPTYENNAKYWAEQSQANQYGAYIVKSAEGDIASFTDGADNIPMKSLKVTITPKQAGSGDPSPDNIRPISGWTTVNVIVSPTTTASDGTTTPVPLGQTVYGGEADVVEGEGTAKGYKSITGNDVADFGTASTGVKYVQINVPSTDSNSANIVCSHYKGVDAPVQAGQTGIRPVGNLLFIYDDRFTDLATAKSLLNASPVQVVYGLATPTQITFDPVSVPSLLGTNNVWSDAGAVEVEYRADPTLAYAELEALILENI